MILFVFALLFGGMSLCAQEQSHKIEISDEEQQRLWQQEDFVRAYLVVADPGGALYSIFGHACLHLVCPAYGLDYYFTYESENAAQKILLFLAGKLKMGMAALTPEEYLSDYRNEGRGVNEYELNLPIGIKRELWRVLDQHVMEGMYLPYDFEARGCAYACTKMLDEALGDTTIAFGPWQEKFNRTRREMGYDKGHTHYPWNMMFIMAMVGTEVDRKMLPQDKLIIPTELAEVWQHATVSGRQLLSDCPVEVLPAVSHPTKTIFTPMMAAILLLVLSIVGWIIGKPYFDWLIWATAMVLGLLMTYLVIFSSLPCTDWNWLIIPFNLLPAIVWKWRKYWALPYAGLLVLWIIGMIVPTHRLVDPSMLIFTVAWIVVLVKNALPLERRIIKK